MLKVARNIQLELFPKRTYVFKEGDPGHHFYIVLEGEISIVKAKKHKEDDIDEHFDVVWRCFRGQSFGETALESA
ncbi:hypothetical protein B484DRAFT_410391, partial [Ochromonadaceae sp. CCMP2298]